MRNLFSDFEVIDASAWKITDFSSDNFFSDTHRKELENKFFPLIEITDDLNRKSVSFQLSKDEAIHGWLKYKEGFSADLVKKFLEEFQCHNGAKILDPFMGSGTTALVAAIHGMNSVGFDILPMSKISINAKSNVMEYDVEELNQMVDFIATSHLPSDFSVAPNELTTTKDAYPGETGKEIAYLSNLIDRSNFSGRSKNLFTLCALNTLERVSYSAKDGQYLRWDHRCPKIIEAEKARLAAGKKPFVVRLDKGVIPSFKSAIKEELEKVIADIQTIQLTSNNSLIGKCEFTEGSALFLLPEMTAESIDAVISSPPYCNRYDYTRTYALELAYLGKSDTDVKHLRQELLSCTVENKSKRERIRTLYNSLARNDDFKKIEQIIADCAPLTETLEALKARAEQGEINNKGVLRMVEGYFYELTFLFFELFRVCKPGARVAFVNDNVRYAGEVVQVDFITSALAEAIGFEVEKIYVLKQKKGNSSQQMKRYGRVALRKSITVWRKRCKL